MKKIYRFVLIIVGIILLLFIIDLIYFSVFQRPLFAIRDYSVHSYDRAYKGLFFNVRDCYGFNEVDIYRKGIYYVCPNATNEIESSYNIVEIEIVEDNGILSIDKIENIKMWFENTTVKGATLVIEATNENPYTYGEWYTIEKQINGKWYELLKDNKEYKFNSDKFLPDENNIVRFHMDWENIYGELWGSNLRIIKKVNDKYIATYTLSFYTTQ